MTLPMLLVLGLSDSPATPGQGMGYEELLAIYGPLGIFAGIMVFVIKALIKREQERSDKLDERNEKLVNNYADVVMPMMGRAAEVMEQTLQYLQEIRERQRIDDRATEIARQKEADRKRRNES